MVKIIVFIVFVIATIPSYIYGKNSHFDGGNVEVLGLFTKSNATYILNFHHTFKDTLYMPPNCKIVFDGGGLSGPIVFNKTSLCGDVNIKGSSISGSIKNKFFNASWLCLKDGVTDDAPAINQMMMLCETIYFPKGEYRLVSKYEAMDVEEYYRGRIHSHLGINKSNITLKGEKGACLITSEPLGLLTIYSRPYDIENSIQNIRIEGLSFKVLNDGINFHEFMLTIETMGVNGLTIKNCFFDDFWGDAICLSHYGDTPDSGERTRNQNIKIVKNTIVGGEHHSNRNGISVINGKNILIKGNIIKNTSRKDMPGAIDVEANNTAYTVENIRIENNIIEGCRGTAGGICINANGHGGPAHRILIKNNTIRRCTSGLAFVVKADGTTGEYKVIDNYVDKETLPYQFVGEGSSRNWIFSGNNFDRFIRMEIPGTIKVDNLVVKNNKKKD